MVQSLLLSNEKNQIFMIWALLMGLEMLAIYGFTKDKILNTRVSDLAETLHIDDYVGSYYLQLGTRNQVDAVPN
jgi:hypothetical protein